MTDDAARDDGSEGGDENRRFSSSNQKSEISDDVDETRSVSLANQDSASPDDGDGRREHEVPLRLYKTVTVFSTLIAVIAVVVGFLLLDAAALGTGLLRRVVIDVLQALSILPSEQVLSALFAVAGLLSIAGGAAVYVLGTRFKAPEMAGGEGGNGKR